MPLVLHKRKRTISCTKCNDFIALLEEYLLPEIVELVLSMALIDYNVEHTKLLGYKRSGEPIYRTFFCRRVSWLPVNHGDRRFVQYSAAYDHSDWLACPNPDLPTYDCTAKDYLQEAHDMNFFHKET